MPRPKDEFFWKYVEKTSEGSICNFCGKLFRGNPSISRMKYHIIGIENKGISVCEKVPGNARQEARLYAEEGANKRQKTLPSSSNYRPDTLNNCHRQSNTVENQSREPGITARDQQIGGEQFLSQGKLTGCMPALMEEPHEDGRFHEGLATELHETEGIALLVMVPVGQKFRENMDWLWYRLMDDGVVCIGIYGMGGVGKTELAKHINNKLIDTPNPFLHVYWVGVSRDFSIIRLQNAIAEAVGLSLSSLEDENVRAAKLCQTLMRKKKSVLILDNVWNIIDFRSIGIPTNITGCKVILTTRSLDLCEKTGCEILIEVKPLKRGEDWELFRESFKNGLVLDSHVKETARLIVEKCEGLPLGIIAIAKNMRKIIQMEEWKCMLEELQQSRPRQGIVEVFESLQLSYNSLDDSILQQSFLSCALYDQPRVLFHGVRCFKNLIIYDIVKGMRGGCRELGKASYTLWKLEDASLYDCKGMHMHPLVRIMAVRMMKKFSETQIVEVSNEHVKELPDEERWTTDLTKVILVDTAIKKIRTNHPPKGPNLRLLLLSGNRNLVFIHDSFFQDLHQLQVLDLSCTALHKLPDSVSGLVNLTSFFIRQCRLLKDVPSLEKLGALKKLDMSDSGVENIPDGMEFLSNLNYLDISGTNIETIPNGILPNLSNLRFLGLGTLVKAEELAGLANLETLMCTFISLSSFNKCMRTLCTETQEVDKFLFAFGDAYAYEESYKEYDSRYDRSVILFRCHGVYEVEDAIYLPKNIQYFRMCHSSIGRSLCLESKSELKCLSIKDCDGMEYLTCELAFESLEILDIWDLKKLRVIFNREGRTPNYTFSGLRKLFIWNCPSVKNLLPECLLPNLKNLEQFRVCDCKLLEEIVTSDPQQFSLPTDAVIQFSLPKLEFLGLEDLPQLKIICRKKLICSSLKQLFAINCPNLDDIPLSLPIQSLENVEVGPKDWWQRVRWENPIAKALVPVITYDD